MDTPTPTPVSTNALAGKKVLIVEDDTFLHGLLAGKLAALRAEGVEVKPTFNAMEALEAARVMKPNLILLDLVLPGMSGFEFLETLRKEEGIKDTPVIILSNLSQDSDHARAKELGVKEFLTKVDFSLDELSTKIVSVLQAS